MKEKGGRMAILFRAVAYREDLLKLYEVEAHSWQLECTYQHPIRCPKGCDKTYVLMHEINASEEQVKEYIDAIHHRMEQDTCPDHPPKIKIDQPTTHN